MSVPPELERPAPVVGIALELRALVEIAEVVIAVVGIALELPALVVIAVGLIAVLVVVVSTVWVESRLGFQPPVHPGTSQLADLLVGRPHRPTGLDFCRFVGRTAEKHWPHYDRTTIARRRTAYVDEHSLG